MGQKVSITIIGVPGQGFKTAMKVLDRGRIHIAAVALGMCDRLIAMALGYAMERKQFGQRIANFQLVQALLADMKLDMLTTEALMNRSRPSSMRARSA
jgi:acyl-CoA dehydrogenase